MTTEDEVIQRIDKRREIWRKARAKKVAFNKKNNLCVDCGRYKFTNPQLARCDRCLKRALDYQNKYNILHKENAKISRKKYRDKNKEELNRKATERRKNNRELYKKIDKRSRLKNRDKINAKQRERRKRLREEKLNATNDKAL